MRFVRSFFGLVFVILAFPACQKRTANETESVTLQAYRLIDEKRSDEAIRLLEGELKRDPDNIEYVAILASAYAAKADISIFRLTPLFISIEKTSKLNLKLSTIEPAIGNGDKTDAVLNNLAIFVTRLTSFISVFISIPNIYPHNAKYLRHSIRLISQLKSRMRREDAAYRALLNIILFKHVLAEHLAGELFFGGGCARDGAASSDSSSCQISGAAVAVLLEELGSIAVSILRDLAAIDKTSSSQFNRIANQLAGQMSSTNFRLLNMPFVEGTLTHVLHQLAKELGVAVAKKAP